VAGDEERCGLVCISMFNVSEGEGGTSETRWDSTAVGGTGMEMGQHLDGLCDPFATNF